MVKAMDCGIVVSEFVLQSRYYVHFRANTLGKGMNPLIPTTITITPRHIHQRSGYIVIDWIILTYLGHPSKYRPGSSVLNFGSAYNMLLVTKLHLVWLTLSVGLRIHRLYSLQRGKSSTKKSVLFMRLNCIRWLGSSSGALDCIKYAIIGTNPRSTLIRSCSNC